MRRNLIKLGSTLIFCLSILMAACQRKGQDEIYLIPKGFEGNIFIVFDQGNGNDILYKDGKRLYVLDNLGTLKTKFKPNYGIIDRAYYYYNDKQGNFTPIKYVYQNSSKYSNEVVACIAEISKSYLETKKTDVHIGMIAIGKQKNIKKIIEQRSSEMWNLIKQLHQ